MALSGYSDYLLFRTAETVLGIFPLNVDTNNYLTPTFTQAQYEAELVNQYNTGMTENEKKVAEYRTNTLVNFITGVTSSAGSMTSFTVEGDNGTPFTITNGDTLEFVGFPGIDIGVADPEVRVALDYSGLDSFIMAATNGTSITVDGANDKLAIYDNDAAEVKYINANQLPGGGGGSSYWSASSSTNHAIIASGYNSSIVGIGTNDPMATLHVNGAGPVLDTVISASSSGAGASIRLSGNTGSFIQLDTTEDGGASGSNAFIGFRSKNNPVWVVGKNHEDATAGPNNFVIATAASFDSNYVVVITSGGSMGLNTETPQRSFHLQAPSNTETPLRINTLQVIDKAEIPYAGVMLSTPDGDVHTATTSSIGIGYWSASSTQSGSIVTSALTTTKVGIGTDTPSALFEVKDLIKFPGSNGDLFIGDSAGANWESGSQSNTALGKLAMGIGTMNGALQNTAIGYASLSYITTGDLNTAVGLQASQALDTGSYNTSLGVTALFGGTYHSYNTAIGALAMYFTTNGALGKSVVNDTHNTAVGYHSQYYNLDGAYNTSVGSQSIGSNTIAMAGTGSTAMGYKSLFNNTTGNYNTALGYQAGDNITTGDYNISIGADVDLPSPTENYQLNIGNLIRGTDVFKNSLSMNSIAIGTGTSTANISKTFTVSGESLMMDHVTLPDNAKLKLGTAGDLEIYHNGSNSYIDDAGTGTIFYRSGTQTFQNAAGSKTSAVFNSGSDQELYFNDTLRFATTNTGAVVTDDLNISGDTVSSGSTSFSGLTHDQIYDMRDYEDSGKALPSDGDGTGFIILGQTHTSITTTGMLCNMYLDSWYVTNPSTPLYLTGATGVALSDTHTATDRILLHGFVRIPASLMNDAAGSSLDKGRPIYADPDTAGEYTVDVGQFTSGEYAKGVGHIMDYDSSSSSYLLYINPSQDFIKIA